MATKDLLALILIFGGIAGGVVITSFSQKARDAAFFLLVAGCVLAERISVNFLSNYWYRGTSRGFEVSFVDILAVSLLVSCWLFPRYPLLGRYWPMSLGLMLLYFFYACFSVAISEPKLYGLFELSKILRGLIVFLVAAWFVQSEKEVKILLIALGCAVCLEGVWAFKQRIVGGIYRVSASLEHPNSLSMYLCAAGPIFVAAAASSLPRLLRLFCWGCAGVVTLAVLFTVSRAGIPIWFFLLFWTVVFTVSLRPTPQKLLAAACVFVGMLIVLATQWQNLLARYSIERSLEEEYFDERSEGRGHYFMLAKAIAMDQFLGVGLNNWSYWVCKRYGAERGWAYQDYDDLDYVPPKEALSFLHYAPPAHNLAAITVGELGWPGLLIFGLVWVRWFQASFPFLRRKASSHIFDRLGTGIFFSIGGVFLQSLTEWTYRQTPILFTFHALLGVLASVHYLKRRAVLNREELINEVETEVAGEVLQSEPAYAMNREGR